MFLISNGVVQYFLFSFALRQQHPMLADVLVTDVLAVSAASSVYKVDLYTLHDQPGLHRIHELIETEPKVCGCIEKETAEELGRFFGTIELSAHQHPRHFCLCSVWAHETCINCTCRFWCFWTWSNLYVNYVTVFEQWCKLLYVSLVCLLLFVPGS